MQYGGEDLSLESQQVDSRGGSSGERFGSATVKNQFVRSDDFECVGLFPK